MVLSRLTAASMVLLVVLPAVDGTVSSYALKGGEMVTVSSEPGSNEVGKRVWGGAKLLVEFSRSGA